MKKNFISVLFVALYLLTVQCVHAKSINLYVQEETGIVRTNHPVRGGIPFPQGELSSADNLILKYQESEVPCQYTVATNWPDGSIKWVWLDFFATVDAGEEKQYSLLINEGMHTSLPLMGIVENESRITVNSGEALFTLSKTAGNVFDRVCTLDQGGNELNEIISQGNNSELYMEAERYNGYDGDVPLYLPMEHFSSRLEEPVSMEIEEHGTKRSVVKVMGRMVDDEGNPISDYICRYYFYQGSQFVRLDFTMVEKYIQVRSNSWEPDHFSKMYLHGVKIDTNLSQGVKQFEIAGSSQNYHGTVEPGEYASIYVRSTGRNQGWQSIQYVLDGKVSGVGDPHSGRGWVDMRNSRYGVSAGTKYFWQTFPKKSYLSGEGLLDIQLYLEDGHEGYGPEGDRDIGFTRLYSGAARGHQILFNFHNEPLSDEDRSVMNGFEQELFVKCDPDWYAGSRAFGDIPVKNFTVRKAEFQNIVDEYYQRFDHVYNVYNKHRNNYAASTVMPYNHCYGYWNFGDQMEDSWGNEMWEPSRGLYLEFVRTGDLQYLRRANEGVLNWLDVGVAHSNYNGGKNGESFLGKPHYNPNNSWHNMGSAHQYNAAAIKGLLLADYYHLVGDRRALDVMDECFSYLKMHHTIDRYSSNYGVRHRANPFLLALAKYDMDNSEEALSEINYYKQGLMSWQDRVDTTFSPSLDPNGDGWVGISNKASGFMAGLALESLMLYEWITGGTDLRDRIVRAAYWMISPHPLLWTGAYNPQPGGQDYFNAWSGSNYGGTYGPTGFMIVAGLGRAYSLTGDQQFLDIANVQVKGSSLLRNTYSKYPKLLGEETRSMPYYLYYLSNDYGTETGEGCDINNDGVVNIQDVIACVNAILGGGSADVNGDNATNIQDVIEIVNVILGV